MTSSSELVSQNFIDSYILLSANEEISDSELDEAARIFGKRTDALQILYRTYVDYDSDSIRIDFKYDDSSAEKLLETIIALNGGAFAPPYFCTNPAQNNALKLLK